MTTKPTDRKLNGLPDHPSPIPTWANRLPLETIKVEAEVLSINPNLLTALVMTESSGNTLAQRFEPGWIYFDHVAEHAKRLGIPPTVEKRLQMTSLGLCQVMGAVAREMGFKGHLRDLLIPKIGLQMGAKKLALCLKHYPRWDEALAAYNGGSPRKDEFGELEPRLQHYVEKVLGYYDQLKT